jgi:hypothetical protein
MELTLVLILIRQLRASLEKRHRSFDGGAREGHPRSESETPAVPGELFKLTRNTGTIRRRI